MKSDAMLCSTVEEIEPAGIQFLQTLTGLRAWTVAPLRKAERQNGKESDDYCVEWLDSQAPAAVLYVSFGSQNTITASQMMSLAEGLEAGGKPFVWVVRPPVGFDVKEEFRDEWLPEGFELRVKAGKRGLVVRKWAPQLEILSHGSTGAFLSHCGWNSVLESLSCGVPVIGWPMAAEQFYNSKMVVEELGAGVEIARGVEGEIESGDVAEMVGLVMGSDCGKGKEMKEKAVRCSVKIRAAMREGGSSTVAIDDFVRMAMSGARLSGDAVSGRGN